MGYDRELFRTNWQAQAPGTNLADFIKNHQDFAEGVQTGGTNGDHATLPGFVEHAGGMTFNRGPEAMDLITDAGPGGRNLSSWSTDAPGGGSGGGTAPLRDIKHVLAEHRDYRWGRTESIVSRTSQFNQSE